MLTTIQGATNITKRALTAAGYSPAEAQKITNHLIDCELRGLDYGGLARGLSIIERVQGQGTPRGEISVTRETASSATVDGGDEVGYLVGDRVTDIALEKVRANGIAVVGAHNTWYTGMFTYYLERITDAGLVGMIAGSGAHIVAPHGSNEARFATNPFAFGFPTSGQPVIWDIGTSETMLAEVLLAHRLGTELPAGRLFGPDGSPSTAPLDLFGGALTVWGGHKGSGLALVVQMLGALTGASYAPVALQDCGFLMIVVDPALLTDADDFRARTSEYADSVRAARPLDPSNPVRMPFDRSSADRLRRRTEDQIDVNEDVWKALDVIARQNEGEFA